MPPDESHALLLSAALRAASLFARDGAPTGRASAGTFEVRVATDFTVALPASRAPTVATSVGRRSWGRIVAQALVASAPWPSYDGYVCVVAEETDARAKQIRRRLNARRRRQTTRGSRTPFTMRTGSSLSCTVSSGDGCPRLTWRRCSERSWSADY